MADIGWRRRRGASPAARRGARQRAGLTPASASNTLSCQRETLHSQQLKSIKKSIDSDHGIYRGGAPMVADLIGGQVQVAFDVLTGSLAHVRSGSLRALGMAGKRRSDALPDVPTIGETVAGYEANSWCGLGVPRGTPAEIIARLNREINAGLADPAVRARLADVATTPIFFTPPTSSAPIWRPRSRSGARWSACRASGRNDRTIITRACGYLPRAP